MTDLPTLEALSRAACTASGLLAWRRAALDLLSAEVAFDAALFHALSPRVPLETAVVLGLAPEVVRASLPHWDALGDLLSPLRLWANEALVASDSEVFRPGSAAWKRLQSEVLRPFGQRSVCVVHLVVQGQVGAVVVLMARRAAAFGPQQVARLKALAPAIAVGDALHRRLEDAPTVPVPTRLVCQDQRLTVRQREVVDYVAVGLSNAEIAQALGLSVHSVRNHLVRIFAAVGASNRADVVRRAVLLPEPAARPPGGLPDAAPRGMHRPPQRSGGLEMLVVAGVSGHVGSVVASKLIEAGRPVRVIVRDAAKGEAWAARGAEVAVGSLEDSAFLEGALAGADGFFTLLPPNFAAADIYGWQRQAAQIIADAVAAAGVKHTVILSSVGADLDAGNGPIKGLFHLEQALRKTHTTLTAIRAGYFQENVANSLAPAQMAGIFPNFAPSADYPMPMIATRDIGALAAQELLAGPRVSEVIDLHGPAYSIRQVASKLGEALGKSLHVLDIPASEHVSAMVQAGLPASVAEVYAEMYAGFASGRIQPRGDRFVQGTTEIDSVIASLVG